MELRGFESVEGQIGIGVERFMMRWPNYSAEELAVNDEKRIRHYQIMNRLRPAGRPFTRDARGFEGFLGFGSVVSPAGVEPTSWAVVVPHWFVALITGVYPAMVLPGWVRRWRRGRRKQCLACGYDLRATPGRCPECGVSEMATV
jgi:hypothetical protein